MDEPSRWPQRIIDSLGREPRAGDWFAECCIEDFHQIRDYTEVQELLDLYDEVDSGGRFWKTEAEGRADLARDAPGKP